ncbi:MAG: SMP-30/gluconolactonase/LRE family protein [Alphaproteobacteria bacterium]
MNDGTKHDAPWRVLPGEVSILGESPVWVRAEQALVWIDGPGRRLHRYDPARDTTSCAEMPAGVGSFQPCAGGGLVLAAQRGFARRDALGVVTPLGVPDAVEGAVHFNDGKCDPRGRFIAGTCDSSYKATVGKGYVLHPDGRCTALHADAGWGYIVFNGPAWSPDGKLFYVNDSPRGMFVADYDLDAATCRNVRPFAAEAGLPGAPDGSAVDAEGFIWSARWDGAAVVRLTPDGRLDRSVPLPVARVTSCAFGGADLKTLYITSATAGLKPDALARQPLAGRSFALPVEVPGLAIANFAG